MDQTATNAKKWALFTGEVGEMALGEERIFICDGRAVTVKLAEVSDLDRVHRGMICID